MDKYKCPDRSPIQGMVTYMADTLKYVNSGEGDLHPWFYTSNQCQGLLWEYAMQNVVNFRTVVMN